MCVCQPPLIRIVSWGREVLTLQDYSFAEHPIPSQFTLGVSLNTKYRDIYAILADPCLLCVPLTVHLLSPVPYIVQLPIDAAFDPST